MTQLDVGAGARERRRQGAVVRRREGRGVDEWMTRSAVIGADSSRMPSSPTASSTPTGASTCSPACDAIAARPPGRASSTRSSSSTTPPTTARSSARSRSASAIGDIRADRARAPHRARPRTTRCCCETARGRATACCSTRTPSCCPGAPRRCSRALDADPRGRRRRRAAAATRRRPRSPAPGASRASAPRSPQALFLHRWLVTAERRRPRPGAVDWAQSSGDAGPPRRRPRQVGWLDPDFFVYSDETDFCKRLGDAGWHTLYVPAAAADPPRAARQRPRAPAAAGSSSSTATATSTCASTTARRGRGVVRGADRLLLPAARPGGARPPRPRPALVPAPRPPGVEPAG